MAEKKVSKYQRCDECHGGYLVVFECRDGKKRCARCKEKFDKRREGNERGKGDKRSIKEARGGALEKVPTARQPLYLWVGSYDWYSGMGLG